MGIPLWTPNVPPHLATSATSSDAKGVEAWTHKFKNASGVGSNRFILSERHHSFARNSFLRAYVDVGKRFCGSPQREEDACACMDVESFRG